MNKFLMFLLAASIMTVSLISVASTAQRVDVKKDLTAKHQAVIPIAAFTANGNLDKLKTAFNEGLDKGLTVNEIKEILIQMYAYCGFPRSLNAINTFMAVTEERTAKGIKDEMGPDASPLPDDKSREQMGRDVRSSLVGGEFPPRGYALFVPTIDLFLKEHLFADIFGRDNLDYQSREIATVSALASLNVPAQLRSHMSICMNLGISEEQMDNLVYILNEKVGKNEADIARAELKAIISTKTK